MEILYNSTIKVLNLNKMILNLYNKFQIKIGDMYNSINILHKALKINPFQRTE